MKALFMRTVLLTWTPSTTTSITGYNVYRSLLSNGVYGSFGKVPYASTVGSVTTYTELTVTDGDTYCYGTTAVDANGESSVSNVVQAAIPVP
jgi:fibronectin type 3 domain-containing protein